MSISLSQPASPLSRPQIQALVRSMHSISHRQILELADALSDAGVLGVAERITLWNLVPLRDDLPPWVDAMRHPKTPDERIDLLKTLAFACEHPAVPGESPRQTLRILRSLRNL